MMPQRALTSTPRVLSTLLTSFLFTSKIWLAGWPDGLIDLALAMSLGPFASFPNVFVCFSYHVHARWLLQAGNWNRRCGHEPAGQMGLHPAVWLHQQSLHGVEIWTGTPQYSANRKPDVGCQNRSSHTGCKEGAHQHLVGSIEDLACPKQLERAVACCR